MSANYQAYRRLGRSHEIKMTTVGQSRAAYDRYPESWPNGVSAPNLGTFADDVLSSGIVERSDALVFGSRGGQVVLPRLWKSKGARVSPAVVINGGCAMQLPSPVEWPVSAVTFLLLGGMDDFRRGLSPADYLMQTLSRVPKGNCTTAVLYVQEMKHMPQQTLMDAILQPMLKTVLSWKAASSTPRSELDGILSVVKQGGWSGCLMFTDGDGAWQDRVFGKR